MYNTYKNPEVTLKSRRKECSPRKRCQPCMKLTDMAGLCSGSVVWARLGQSWWPGTVTTLDKCPTEYVQSLNEMKKMPIAIVKFFNENEFQDIHKEEHISVYNCDRKEEFIRKGQSANKNQTHDGVDLLKKFEADVVTAEKLTGGDMSIIENMRGGSVSDHGTMAAFGTKEEAYHGTSAEYHKLNTGCVTHRIGGDARVVEEQNDHLATSDLPDHGDETAGSMNKEIPLQPITNSESLETLENVLRKIDMHNVKLSKKLHVSKKFVDKKNLKHNNRKSKKDKQFRDNSSSMENHIGTSIRGVKKDENLLNKGISITYPSKVQASYGLNLLSEYTDSEDDEDLLLNHKVTISEPPALLPSKLHADTSLIVNEDLGTPLTTVSWQIEAESKLKQCEAKSNIEGEIGFIVNVPKRNEKNSFDFENKISYKMIGDQREVGDPKKKEMMQINSKDNKYDSSIITKLNHGNDSSNLLVSSVGQLVQNLKDKKSPVKQERDRDSKIKTPPKKLSFSENLIYSAKNWSNEQQSKIPDTESNDKLSRRGNINVETKVMEIYPKISIGTLDKSKLANKKADIGKESHIKEKAHDIHLVEKTKKVFKSRFETIEEFNHRSQKVKDKLQISLLKIESTLAGGNSQNLLVRDKSSLDVTGQFDHPVINLPDKIKPSVLDRDEYYSRAHEVIPESSPEILIQEDLISFQNHSENSQLSLKELGQPRNERLNVEYNVDISEMKLKENLHEHNKIKSNNIVCDMLEVEEFEVCCTSNCGNLSVEKKSNFCELPTYKERMVTKDCDINVGTRLSNEAIQTDIPVEVLQKETQLVEDILKTSPFMVKDNCHNKCYSSTSFKRYKSFALESKQITEYQTSDLGDQIIDISKHEDEHVENREYEIGETMRSMYGTEKIVKKIKSQPIKTLSCQNPNDETIQPNYPGEFQQEKCFSPGELFDMFQSTVENSLCEDKNSVLSFASNLSSKADDVQLAESSEVLIQGDGFPFQNLTERCLSDKASVDTIHSLRNKISHENEALIDSASESISTVSIIDCKLPDENKLGKQSSPFHSVENSLSTKNATDFSNLPFGPFQNIESQVPIMETSSVLVHPLDVDIQKDLPIKNCQSLYEGNKQIRIKDKIVNCIYSESKISEFKEELSNHYLSASNKISSNMSQKDMELCFQSSNNEILSVEKSTKTVELPLLNTVKKSEVIANENEAVMDNETIPTGYSEVMEEKRLSVGATPENCPFAEERNHHYKNSSSNLLKSEESIEGKCLEITEYQSSNNKDDNSTIFPKHGKDLDKKEIVIADSIQVLYSTDEVGQKYVLKGRNSLGPCQISIDEPNESNEKMAESFSEVEIQEDRVPFQNLTESFCSNEATVDDHYTQRGMIVQSCEPQNDFSNEITDVDLISCQSPVEINVQNKSYDSLDKSMFTSEIPGDIAKLIIGPLQKIAPQDPITEVSSVVDLPVDTSVQKYIFGEAFDRKRNTLNMKCSNIDSSYIPEHIEGLSDQNKIGSNITPCNLSQDENFKVCNQSSNKILFGKKSKTNKLENYNNEFTKKEIINVSLEFEEKGYCEFSKLTKDTNNRIDVLEDTHISKSSESGTVILSTLDEVIGPCIKKITNTSAIKQMTELSEIEIENKCANILVKGKITQQIYDKGSNLNAFSEINHLIEENDTSIGKRKIESNDIVYNKNMANNTIISTNKKTKENVEEGLYKMKKCNELTDGQYECNKMELIVSNKEVEITKFGSNQTNMLQVKESEINTHTNGINKESMIKRKRGRPPKKKNIYSVKKLTKKCRDEKEDTKMKEELDLKRFSEKEITAMETFMPFFIDNVKTKHEDLMAKIIGDVNQEEKKKSCELPIKTASGSCQNYVDETIRSDNLFQSDNPIEDSFGSGFPFNKPINIKPHYSVEPIQSCSPVDDPHQSGYTVDEPPQSGSPVDEPLQSCYTVNEPLQCGSPVDEPLQSGSPIDEPLQSSSPVDEPLQSGSPVDEPLQSGSPVDEPLQSGFLGFPADEPLQSGFPVEKPLQSSSPVDELLQSGSPVDELLQSGSPIDEPLQSGSPVDEPIQSGFPVDEPVQSGFPVDEPIQSDYTVDEPIQSCYTVDESRQIGDLHEPFQSGYTVDEHLQSGYTFDEPLQSDYTGYESPQIVDYIYKPLQSGYTVDESLQSGNTVDEPLQSGYTVGEPLHSSNPLDEPPQSSSPDHEHLQSVKPLDEPLQFSSSVYKLLQSVSPVHKSLQSGYPVEEPLPSVYPVNEPLQLDHPVKEHLQSGYHVDEPLHSGHSVDNHLQSGYTVGEPLQFGYPDDETFQSGYPVDEPFQSGEPIHEPFQSDYIVEEPFQSGDPVEPLQLGSPVHESPQSGYPAVEPLQSSKPVDETLQSGCPIDAPYQSGYPINEPSQTNSNVQSLYLVHEHLQSDCPVDEPSQYNNFVDEPIDFNYPVDESNKASYLVEKRISEEISGKETFKVENMHLEGSYINLSERDKSSVRDKSLVRDKVKIIESAVQVGNEIIAFQNVTSEAPVDDNYQSPKKVMKKQTEDTILQQIDRDASKLIENKEFSGQCTIISKISNKVLLVEKTENNENFSIGKGSNVLHSQLFKPVMENIMNYVSKDTYIPKHSYAGSISQLDGNAEPDLQNERNSFNIVHKENKFNEVVKNDPGQMETRNKAAKVKEDEQIDQRKSGRATKLNTLMKMKNVIEKEMGEKATRKRNSRSNTTAHPKKQKTEIFMNNSGEKILEDPGGSLHGLCSLNDSMDNQHEFIKTQHNATKWNRGRPKVCKQTNQNYIKKDDEVDKTKGCYQATTQNLKTNEHNTKKRKRGRPLRNESVIDSLKRSLSPPGDLLERVQISDGVGDAVYKSQSDCYERLVSPDKICDLLKCGSQFSTLVDVTSVEKSKDFERSSHKIGIFNDSTINKNEERGKELPKRTRRRTKVLDATIHDDINENKLHIEKKRGRPTRKYLQNASPNKNLEASFVTENVQIPIKIQSKSLDDCLEYFDDGTRIKMLEDEKRRKQDIVTVEEMKERCISKKNIKGSQIQKRNLRKQKKITASHSSGSIDDSSQYSPESKDKQKLVEENSKIRKDTGSRKSQKFLKQPLVVEKTVRLAIEVPGIWNENILTGLHTNVPEFTSLDAVHNQGSSDDSDEKEFSDEDLPDLSAALQEKQCRKKLPGSRFKEGNIVWVRHQHKWWPAYIKAIYQRENKASVRFINCQQTQGIQVKFEKLKAFHCEDFVSFINQRHKGFTQAVNMATSFVEMQRNDNSIKAEDFFGLSLKERQELVGGSKAILISSEEEEPEITHNNSESSVSILNKTNKYGMTSSVLDEVDPQEEPGIPTLSPSDGKDMDPSFMNNFKEPSSPELNSDPEPSSVSKRSKKKLENALKVRRLENKKMVKFMRTAGCLKHLWRIYKKEFTSERHDIFQDEENRFSLMFGGIGSFHLDEEGDELIIELIKYYQENLSAKQPDFRDSKEYARVVWMPEAMRHYYRKVKRIPEDRLDTLLLEGYQETRAEQQARARDKKSWD